jgi:hypothetical protein
MLSIADVGCTDEYPTSSFTVLSVFSFPLCSCGFAVTLDSSGVFVCQGLAVGEHLLAEIKDGQRAWDTSRSADGNDGKVPVDMLVSERGSRESANLGRTGRTYHPMIAVTKPNPPPILTRPAANCRPSGVGLNPVW